LREQALAALEEYNYGPLFTPASVQKLKQLGLHSLGRPARGQLLLTNTVLIVGQEGGKHRE
jgi:hypothetical protein